jgi:hypothetical protein
VESATPHENVKDAQSAPNFDIVTFFVSSNKSSKLFSLFHSNSVINGLSSVSTKEDIMASLKSLTLTALPQIQADPVRRNRTIAHLEGAKTIATGPELYANNKGLGRK